MKKVILVVISLFLIIAVIGCGSKGETTTPVQPTEPVVEPAIDVMGSWIVKDQSAEQYNLNFKPDGTFEMTSAATKSEGTYAVGGETVILVPTSGEEIRLKYVKGPDMMQDQLVGDVTWVRV
jgi:predicted small lipoprotein YifL